MYNIKFHTINDNSSKKALKNKLTNSQIISIIMIIISIIGYIYNQKSKIPEIATSLQQNELRTENRESKIFVAAKIYRNISDELFKLQDLKVHIKEQEIEINLKTDDKEEFWELLSYISKKKIIIKNIVNHGDKEFTIKATFSGIAQESNENIFKNTRDKLSIESIYKQLCDIDKVAVNEINKKDNALLVTIVYKGNYKALDDKWNFGQYVFDIASLKEAGIETTTICMEFREE